MNRADSADRTLNLADGLAVRLACRNGQWTGHTSGAAKGFVQTNLVVLPEAWAGDFLRFCQQNVQACPVIGISKPGSARIPELCEDLDIRKDLPKFRVWRDGAIAGEQPSVEDVWRDDFVSFAIGCSFTFDHALIAAGIPLRHVSQGINVAMYRTSIETAPAGLFRGPLVVSMRPLTAERAERAGQITSKYPTMHGAPVHIGCPELIGIQDITRPDYGDPIEIADGELPVFWACGVTPQAALAAAKLPIAITHAPGCMLVTDLRHEEYFVI